MKDKMSNSTSSNTPPEEFIEYLHNLLEEIIVNNEELSRFNKWLKKYCDEYDSSYDEVQASIADFTELLNEYRIKPTPIFKRILIQTGYKLFLTDNQITNFIEQIGTTIKDNTKTNNHGHKNVTADWFNTQQRRTQWWNQLEEQWKRAFNEMIMEESTIDKIPDESIIDILNLKRLLVVGKDGYMLEEDIKLSIKTLSFKIDNLSGIQDLTNLTSLWCNNNNLDSIKELQFLPSLTFLNISDNILTDLKPISKLVKLESLMCGNNLFESLVDIIKLEKLVYLNCENNNLSNLLGIKYLKKLQSLNFADNNITDLSELESMVNLNLLNCDNNKIEALDSLEVLLNKVDTNDFHLSLWENPIRDVKFNNRIINEAAYLTETYSWLNIFYSESGYEEETAQQITDITNHSGDKIDNSKVYFFDAPAEIGDLISKDSTISIDNSGQKKGICSFVGEKGVSFMVGTRRGDKPLSTYTLVFSEDYDTEMSVVDNYEETFLGDKFVNTSFYIKWIQQKRSVFSIGHYNVYDSGLPFCYSAEYAWTRFKHDSIINNLNEDGFVDFVFATSSNSYIRVSNDTISQYKKAGILTTSMKLNNTEVLTNPGIFHFRDKSNYKKTMFSTTGEIIINRSSIYNFKNFLWLFNQLTSYDLV